jgi:Uma2 family endonuclease
MDAILEMQTKVSAEPTWEIALLFPPQGQWSVSEYLALDTNHLVELSHGQLEVLPVASERHQDIVLILIELLRRYLSRRRAGKAAIAPLPVQLWPGKFREPDIMFMLAHNQTRRTEQYWIGADLVMEVISPESRQRDVALKRREYAEARITEYWLVDPEYRRIIVLQLQGQSYVEHGDWGAGEQATSLLLPGFVVSVDEVFGAAD